MRRTDSACAEDDLLRRDCRLRLARREAVLDTCGDQSTKHDARGVGACDDREVRAPLDLAFEKRLIRAGASAIARAGLHERGNRGSAAISSVVVTGGEA